MKSIIAASLIASAAAAAAFAPVQQSADARSSFSSSLVVVNMASFENELGAQPPLGFFDPLGLVADGDQDKFDRLRYVELKHGRVCMLAVVGYLTTEAGYRLPGDIDYAGTKFADIPSGFDALVAIPQAGLAQVVIFCGFLELAVMKDLVGGEFVGDFRNDAFDLGWDSFNEDTKMKKRAIELNQGRAAQMGILALMVHEQLGVSLLPSQ
jgi:Chlorophyll A-B binding protein